MGGEGGGRNPNTQHSTDFMLWIHPKYLFWDLLADRDPGNICAGEAKGCFMLPVPLRLALGVGGPLCNNKIQRAATWPTIAHHPLYMPGKITVRASRTAPGDNIVGERTSRHFW